MLTNILMLLVSAAASFLTILLLARFVMQWQRLPFRNQVGQFIAVTTNWLVLPLRKIIPGLGGLDMASLVAAWLVQALAVGIGQVTVGAELHLDLRQARLQQPLERAGAFDHLGAGRPIRHRGHFLDGHALANHPLGGGGHHR